MVKAGRVEHLEWPLRSAQKAAITSLVERSSAVSGRPAMSDHLSLDLANDSPGVVACAISTSTGEMVGYGQASPVHQGYLVGTVGAADVHRGLLAALLERTENTPVTWWVFDPDASSEDAASANGLRPGRQLLQMRCPLPLPTAVNRSAAAAPTRPFRVGVDERAWIETNNAAFAWHAEQGGWTIADLLARQAEPWWNADGFRVLDIDGRMAGFCWTKVHDDPPLGEIYVVAVHPDFHGRGLGRLLTVDGLSWLATHGSPTGMLYVDADNISAVRLYESLGFATAQVQQAYTNVSSLADTDPQEQKQR